MSQFSVAPARTTSHRNHPVGKNFSFSSDQMTMMNLLGRGERQHSNGVVKIPTNGASLRSPTHRHQPKPFDPHHRSTTTNFRDRTSRFDSHESSSVPVGDADSLTSHKICGHQPMTVTANQISPTRTSADSEVTLWHDSHISHGPFEVPRNGDSLRSMTNQPNSHQNSQIKRMSLSSDQGDFPIKMKGSPDAYGNDFSSDMSTMSVTSALRRSRAIAIHPTKTSHPADLEELHAQESLKIYDQATWRMYNRIVDHRRNHQAPLVAQTHQGKPTSVVSDNYQTLRSLQVLNSELDFHFTNNDGDDYHADDGEIFQLDL